VTGNPSQPRRQLLPLLSFFSPAAEVFRWVTGVCIVCVYVGSVGATWCLIYLAAFGEVSLPSSFMQWLGATTLAELAPLFALLVNIVWGRGR